MTASPVERLNAALDGRYAIERELGEGGMATVCLADDLKHERKVALKVLKPELAAVVGAERFLAEIKTTANLTHPHILPLHDSGEADSFLFYVMPYVEGETLQNRIAREHQLPVDDAVRIATNVSEALDYAHRHGVIHRDIKPANILLQDGKPVISDFGIALAVGVAGGGRLTETGLSVGTPHYMSPEQATGDLSVGAATDIYALGCALYEMLVGEPPYTGSTAQAILGKIIQGKTASAAEERASVPQNVDAAIRKALEKLPADRFVGAQDFSKALGDPGFRHGVEVTAGMVGGRGHWNPLSIGMTGVAALAVMFGAWALTRPETTGQVSRFEVTLPDGLEPNVAYPGGVTVSPDGSEIVFRGTSEGLLRLWRRSLDQLTPTPIPGTDAAWAPRYSPDGTMVAFFAGGNAITTVSLAGAPPMTLVVELAAGGWFLWGTDGWLYFTNVDQTIWRVPVEGGPWEQVTTLAEDDAVHGHGEVLPDGRGLLFTRQGFGGIQVAVLSFETGEVTTLFEGLDAHYAASGHIVYSSVEGTLLAAPFDLGRLRITGPSRSLVEGLLVNGGNGSSYSAMSESGVLVYLTGEVGGYSETELVWVSRSGVAQPVEAGWRFESPTDDFGWSLSPDGTQVAVTGHVEGNLDIWIKELSGGPFERLTFDEALQAYPVWAPDDRMVSYVSGQLLGFDVWQRRADGTGSPELVHDDERSLLQPRWSSNGEWMVFRTTEGAVGRDIVGLRPGVDTAVVSLVVSDEFTEWGPALSPDGRWLAYSSDQTGREEVYVRPFPDVGSSLHQVSVGGGSNPCWAHGGGEIFYLEEDGRFISASLQTEPAFRVLTRETLFTLGPEYLLGDGGADYYEVAPDDQRFLMGRRAGESLAGPGGFVVVQNFFEELRRLVPAN